MEGTVVEQVMRFSKVSRGLYTVFKARKYVCEEKWLTIGDRWLKWSYGHWKIVNECYEVMEEATYSAVMIKDREGLLCFAKWFFLPPLRYDIDDKERMQEIGQHGEVIMQKHLV